MRAVAIVESPHEGVVHGHTVQKDAAGVLWEIPRQWRTSQEALARGLELEYIWACPAHPGEWAIAVSPEQKLIDFGTPHAVDKAGWLYWYFDRRADYQYHLHRLATRCLYAKRGDAQDLIELGLCLVDDCPILRAKDTAINGLSWRRKHDINRLMAKDKSAYDEWLEFFRQTPHKGAE